MLVYENFTFVSAPRTASTWFVSACASAGLTPLSGGAFDKHSIPTKLSPDDLRVTLVRRPIDWLQSYYLSFVCGHPVQGVPKPFAELSWVARAAPDWQVFLNAYLLGKTPSVSDCFDCYQASICLRVEDLPWAASSFLQSMGVSAEQSLAACDVPASNGRNGRKIKSTPPTKEQVRAVFDKERDFCERYEYF